MRTQVGEESAIPARQGDVFDGKWRLERKLGEGGMGTVFLAHDLQLDRKVAIKLLSVALANDAELVMRFEREGRMTAGLEHPNIVPVYAVGRFHSRPFMVMKALEGGTLHTLIRSRGPLAPKDMLHVARQVGAGLDFIHSKGFIHRDIKAANIFISPEGHATILDFGILRPSRGAEAITRTGLVMGTPHYMSPEQAKGIRDLDHRSDLYAFAVLLFECIAGALPFESDNDLSVIQMQAHFPPPDLCSKAPHAPRLVADVLARALSKDPNARYPTAAALVRALEAAYAGQAPLPLGRPSEAPVAASLSSPHPSASPAAPPVPVGARPTLDMAVPVVPPHVSMPVPLADAASAPGPQGVPAPAVSAGSAFAPPAAPSVPGPDTQALARSLRRPLWPILVGVVLLGGGGAYLYFSSRGGDAPPVGTGIAAVGTGNPTPDVTPPPAADAPDAAVPEDAGTGEALAQATPDSGTATPAEAPDAGVGAGEEVAEEVDADPAPLEPEQPANTGKPKAAPVRGKGKLSVVSTRHKEAYWAKVAVDGVKKGTTPLSLELPAGVHRVRLERIGFKPVERQIKISAGRSAVLRVELVP